MKQYLAQHPKQVFSRNQLLNQLWDMDFYGDTTTVTVHIRRLREKVEDNPSQPRYIRTVWGIGYHLLLQPDIYVLQRLARRFITTVHDELE